MSNPEHNPNGDFALQGNRIVEHAPALTFSGVGAYHPALFADVPTGQPAKLAPLLRAAIAQGHVGGTHHAGCWMDVGTPQRLEELDQQLRVSGRP